MKNFILFSLFFLLFTLKNIAQTAFRHTTNATNISGHTTVLNHALLNGKDSAIIFILPVWDKNQESYSCKNYAQNAGVKYDEITKKWAIVNQNPNLPMLQNQAFNVLVMPGESAYCFSVVCERTNRIDNGHAMTINHPATNNNPNALLLLTQNYHTTYNNNSQLVYYNNGKWGIANDNFFFPVCEGDKSVLPFGAKFNVLVIEKDRVIVPGFPKASTFLHKTTNIPPATNIEYINQHVSVFEAPQHNVFNLDPNMLIFATANLGWSQPERPLGAPIGNLYTDSPLVAWQIRTNSKWSVVNANAVPFKEGTLINVMAIKELK